MFGVSCHPRYPYPYAFDNLRLDASDLSERRIQEPVEVEAHPD